jgi:hypothetical protein
LDTVLFDAWLRMIQHALTVAIGGGLLLFIMMRFRA